MKKDCPFNHHTTQSAASQFPKRGFSPQITQKGRFLNRSIGITRQTTKMYHELISFKPAKLLTRGPLLGACAALVLASGLYARQARAIEIVLGPADFLALDQPRIAFDLLDPSTGVSAGPGFNLALLDTGANGVLLASPAYGGGEDYGTPLFEGSPAQYNELGVAGTTALDIHDLHDLRITDSAGRSVIPFPDLRPFGDNSLNIGSYAAIIGMPAMDGYAVEIDMRPNLALDFQSVLFHDAIGEAAFESASTLNVDLRILPPEHTDTTFLDADPPRPDLLPTFVGLPVIDNVDMKHTGGANSLGGEDATMDKTFLVDTGAQTMIINEAMAIDLGLDFTNRISNGGDVIDFLEVGGIGGFVDMPLVAVDEFVMPAQSGVDLVWTDVVVGVLNIDGAPFDAVLGMNMLTTGYINAVFGGGGGETTLVTTDAANNPDIIRDAIDNGVILTVEELAVFAFNVDTDELGILIETGLLPDTNDLNELFDAALQFDEDYSFDDTALNDPIFDKVVFDFTADDGTALMRLDFADLIPSPFLLGDADGDGDVDAFDIAAVEQNFGNTGAADGSLLGDADGDGDVDAFDLTAVEQNFGNVLPVNEASSADPIPEPGSLLLLTLAGVVIVARRRR